jgi:protein O-GlcNAc transferase
MEFLPGVSQRELFLEQREWDHLYGSGKLLFPVSPASRQGTTGSRIKVGYVSAFFYHHAEAFFVLPLLESHDRTKFEIHCYSDVSLADEITRRHQAAVDRWHDCRALSNDALAEQIHRDQIEILIDLMMHMGRNRAPVFARKPAPVQIAWLAYPGGTGLRAIDYRITDAVIDPPGTDSFCCEKSIRLPHCWCCYDPLCDIPPAPRRSDRPITFGSLNNPRKLNAATIRLWAQAMSLVHGSRMIILSISASQRSNILKVFQAMGISSDRIEFVGRMQRPEYLCEFDQIDIALDPLPYAGITTTCDALWMGVPVVTLAGETAAGRASSSIITAAGLNELATTDADQFVTAVSRLSNDPPRLNEMRSTLRERCVRSKLMDARQFARDFESALAGTRHKSLLDADYPRKD